MNTLKKLSDFKWYELVCFHWYPKCHFYSSSVWNKMQTIKFKDRTSMGIDQTLLSFVCIQFFRNSNNTDTCSLHDVNNITLFIKGFPSLARNFCRKSPKIYIKKMFVIIPILLRTYFHAILHKVNFEKWKNQ